MWLSDNKSGKEKKKKKRRSDCTRSFRSIEICVPCAIEAHCDGICERANAALWWQFRINGPNTTLFVFVCVHDETMAKVRPRRPERVNRNRYCQFECPSGALSLNVDHFFDAINTFCCFIWNGHIFEHFFLLFTYYFSFMNYSPFFFSIFSLEIFRQYFNSASVRLWSGLKCVGAHMSKFGIVIVTQRWKLFRTHVFVALSPFGKQTEF